MTDLWTPLPELARLLGVTNEALLHRIARGYFQTPAQVRFLNKSGTTTRGRIFFSRDTTRWLLAGCEVCAWPAGIDVPRIWGALHFHHVRPQSQGGTSADGVILLCPNHHTSLHSIFGARFTRYRGPIVRDEILAALFDAELTPLVGLTGVSRRKQGDARGKK